MPVQTEPKPKVPSNASTEVTSGLNPDLAEAQLSTSARVQPDVSSVAMDRGLLAMSGVPQEASLEGYAGLPGEGLSDAELMLQVKAGNDSAFEYLVQKYRRPMLNFMYRMAHNSAAAEDLAQEVFLRVYRSRESYEATAKFSTWLYRIATNLAMNFTRDTRHERPENQVSLDEPAEEDSAPLDVADRRLTEEQDLLRRERRQQVRKRVQALPERQRLA